MSRIGEPFDIETAKPNRLYSVAFAHEFTKVRAGRFDVYKAPSIKMLLIRFWGAFGDNCVYIWTAPLNTTQKEIEETYAVVLDLLRAAGEVVEQGGVW
jgi:hypothetical protein